ncbi:DUF4133 domain-containing protein [Pseudoflavitalea sp. X16]|uniref:DUF4133 domain-containing protein n=1 Tax=Paraflavitalea devenefica TaxID=2716334 RepID=UPI001424A1DE|nr:DUF4133 domain-containing protein [Paraflavitalea devenefica]NII26154.1 DUF4133 domain-containing protein [Paraflavitalea devenefica]
MSIVYEINRGINRPIEFKGLKAQYIWWLGGGLGILLVLFSIGYLAGVHLYVCIAITGILGCGLFSQVYRLSHKYGEHGLMKAVAYKQVPSAICCYSRLLFTTLRSK